ncbi:amino acid ABC transporter permease [Aminobacter sp. MSH1]|uniref:amino acid ABC transporter permease n=1 Tax=Aminobacter sp. MSH1 TaxID=374606 RepID=UPI000D39B3D3|nr:amino acid ABC transporter permease [Aminobacter sp. MSH1]
MGYELHFNSVLAYAPDLLAGALLTLKLAAGTIFFGMILGTLCALVRVEAPFWLSLPVRTYVAVIRNTPLLVQLFIAFFGLPLIGIKASANTAALVTMIIHLGAYVTEIVRAGIQSIPKTQFEAGLALSLSRWQVYRYIIAVPALQTIYPALTGQFTLIVLGSSVASAISASELTSVAGVVESHTFRSLETYLVVTVIYICITVFLRLAYYAIGRLIFRRKVAAPSMATPLSLQKVVP